MTEKEKTAPIVSVGADTEQSILKQTNNSITDLKRNFNKFYIKGGGNLSLIHISEPTRRS